MIPLAAEHLEGGRVVGTDGRDLGRIRDVVVDLDSGAIAFVEVEGDAGRYRVPWQAVRADDERACFVVDAPGGLAAAPGAARHEAA